MCTRYRLILPIFLLFWTGCSIGSVVVDVNSDGSGTMELRSLHVENVENQPEVKGASQKRNSTYSIDRLSYEFDRLSDVSLDDLTFQVQQQEDTSRISMTVPLTRKSGWVRQMKLTEQRIKKLKKRFKKMSEQGDQRAFRRINPEEALKVKFQVNAPDEIENYEIDAPELEEHEWISEKNVQNNDPANNQLVVDVPVRAIFNEEINELSVRLSFESPETTEKQDGKSEKEENGKSQDQVKTY